MSENVEKQRAQRMRRSTTFGMARKKSRKEPKVAEKEPKVGGGGI